MRYNKAAIYRAACSFMLMIFSVPALEGPLTAQSPIELETAKPADSVSPYGVSYLSGSFSYNLPILEIGNGEWPNKLSVVLKYDSAANRSPNSAWTLDEEIGIRKTDIRDETDANGIRTPENDIDQISVIAGGVSIPFSKVGSNYNIGSFEPSSLNGSSLSFEPETPSAYDDWGSFVFTSRNGDILKDTSVCCGPGSEYLLASGDHVKWRSRSGGSMLSSNRGISILVEQTVSLGNNLRSQKICSFNLTLIDQSLITNCNESTNVSTIIYRTFETYLPPQVISVTLPDHHTYNFEYVRISAISGPTYYEGLSRGPQIRYHLSCIKEPAAANCLIKNEYDACDGAGTGLEDWDFTGSRDRVKKQTLGDGRVVTYTYSPYQTPCRAILSTTISEGNISHTIEAGGIDSAWWLVPNVLRVKDALNRTTSYGWKGANPAATWINRDDLLGAVAFPEGDSLDYSYDTRGNITSVRRKAKPGSNVPDLVTSAVFPMSCDNRKTCNKPISKTDARGNTTDYEYDPLHGGLIREINPADASGVRPVKRYYYQQRSAWLKSGNGYALADSPVWLLVRERFCQNTQMIGEDCTGGSGDEVVTNYEYGPNSGPNNLWLRGMAVTAIGLTLRTCYMYNAQGNQISKTSPRAGLNICQ